MIALSPRSLASPPPWLSSNQQSVARQNQRLAGHDSNAAKVEAVAADRGDEAVPSMPAARTRTQFGGGHGVLRKFTAT
jgi:hypothetical protein